MTEQQRPSDPEHNDAAPLEVTTDRLSVSWSGLTRDQARRTVAGGLGLLLVVGLVACIWLGWRATRGEDPTPAQEAAQERDSALDAATDGLVAFHTVDHRKIEDVVSRWADLSTGQLHEMVETGRKAVVRKVVRSRTVSSARVVRAALASFDADAGDARVVAVVSIRTRGKGDRETTRDAEFLCLVQRDAGDWKLSAMQGLGGRS